MRVIIDRFEQGFAVVELEDGSFALMAINLLPDAREGDVVEIKVDREETDRRKDLIRALQQKAKT
ncbi:MAG TPA: DUF3006 domain-containing protein [Firmicutes bacterium]|nr:DUF3006 domain-containing protein [Bacillota bacterium]HBR29484.1 DUF3006 domain-containing protein [Bacillota bacterium]HBR34138.1 DUF3006 domain-containing protein [Bacillota bacterium]